MKELKLRLLAPLAVLAAALPSSCARSDGRILGVWESRTLQKTQLLSEPGNFESAFAYAYVQKEASLSFMPDGTFTKRVSQETQKVDFVDESYRPHVAIQEGGASYALEGRFSAKGGFLVLLTERAVIRAGGQELELSGEEMDAQNLLLESAEEVLPYRISDAGLELWDAQLDGYLAYSPQGPQASKESP